MCTQEFKRHKWVNKWQDFVDSSKLELFFNVVVSSSSLPRVLSHFFYWGSNQCSSLCTCKFELYSLSLLCWPASQDSQPTAISNRHLPKVEDFLLFLHYEQAIKSMHMQEYCALCNITILPYMHRLFACASCKNLCINHTMTLGAKIIVGV